MKSTLAGTGPFVSASRMVKDYTTDLYEPAAAHAHDMAADAHPPAREMASWKTRIVSGWSGVGVEAVESDGAMPGIGDERSVEAVVTLGSLSGADIEVQLVHGAEAVVVDLGDAVERHACHVLPLSSEDVSPRSFTK